MNIVALTGRLAKEPVLRKTPTGKSVVSFTLAVKDSFNKEKTNFINCQAWGGVADFVSVYLDKGALVEAQGELQVQMYEDKETKQNRYKTFVNCRLVQGMESKQAKESRINGTSQVPSTSENQAFEDVPTDDFSDNLPF